MLKKQILILCFLLGTLQSSSFFLESSTKLIKLAWKLSGKLEAGKSHWEATKSTVESFADIFLGYTSEQENAEVLEKIGELSNQLNKMQTYIGKRFQAIENVLTRLPQDLSIDADKKSLRSYIEEIDIQFARLTRHIRQRKHLTRDVWQDFARSAIEEVQRCINRIRILLAPAADHTYLNSGLIMSIANQTAGLGLNVCKEIRSAHQVVAHLVELAMLMEGKVMNLLTIIYPIRFPKVWKLQVSNAQQDLETRYMMYMRTSLDAMSITPESLKACDPQDGAWVRDVNYFEMEKLKQAIFFNKFSRWTGYDYFPPDAQKIANGIECKIGFLSDCQSSQYHTCWSKNDPKRIEWVKEKGQIFGVNYPKCDHVWDFRSYCNCNGNNENSVFLAAVETQVDENMVVTGAQLVRRDKVMYIQLKQGKLLPNGQIDPKSQSWIPLPTDSGPKKNITSTYNRFFLNDLVLPFQYVLTGIKFNDQSGITLQAIGRKFNYSSGELLSDTIAVPKSFDENEFDELKVGLRNSIYTEQVHIPHSGKHWIRLQRSDLRGDAGQSVLPLFDNQRVETNPPLPLGGIGLFHKGVEGYAGFIALQLHSLPYKRKIEELLKEYKAEEIFDKK